jgi:putative sterol carrier protein
MELFDDRWAAAWKRALIDETDYPTKGTAWDAPVVLRCHDDDASAKDRGTRFEALYAELSAGNCRVARPATAADVDRAEVVLTMKRSEWEQILSGRADPIFAAMTGKVQLTRGSLGQLLPHAAAAKELLAAARLVESRRVESPQEGERKNGRRR